MKFKKIFVAFFSGMLFMNVGGIIYANATYNSDEGIVEAFDQYDRGNGVTVIYDQELGQVAGFLTTDELEKSLSENELNNLLSEEAKNVILENTPEFNRIKSVLEGAYDESEASHFEITASGDIKTIECDSGVVIHYDDLGQITGFMYPNEIEGISNEDELNNLLLEEAKNVILENIPEFHRIKSVLEGTDDQSEVQNLAERIQYNFPINAALNPFGSRGLFGRSISLGETVSWSLRASSLAKELEKASSVTVSAFDANRNKTVFTISIGSSNSSNYRETTAYRILDFSAKNNTSSSINLTGNFNFGK